MSEKEAPRLPLTPYEKMVTVILLLVVLCICVTLYFYVMGYGGA